jgi:hypothetical protein
LTPKRLHKAEQQNQVLLQCDLQDYSFISSQQKWASDTAKIALVGICDQMETSTDLMEI